MGEQIFDTEKGVDSMEEEGGHRCPHGSMMGIFLIKFQSWVQENPRCTHFQG
jgi:hypothetical protein